MLGCAERLDPSKYELVGLISRESIPADEDEAIEKMHLTFSAALNADLVRCDGIPQDKFEFCRDFSTHVRDPLRRLISNEWMRPRNSPLAAAYSSREFDNPEVMSYGLMAAYVEHLREAQ
jgi:hypothetical protein